MPRNALWRDTRIGTTVESVTGVRGTVEAISPPVVRIRVAGGSAIDVQVRPDDPVEIVVPSGQGERNVVDLLGATSITGWEPIA